MDGTLDQLLDEATASRRVPGIVAGVFDSEGTRFEGAYGSKALDTGEPMALDAAFQIMSMTKAIAGVACLQAVERGLLTLDGPAKEFVPELGELEVLDGFDGDGQPQLRPAVGDVTLRQLLTHTAGFVYHVWNADLLAYLKVTGHPGVTAGTRESHFLPLAFDPGTSWAYGTGIDFATMMLEAATDRSLSDYLATELFEPLGMPDTTYTPDDELLARSGPVHTRDEHGRFNAYRSPTRPPRTFHGGGGGLYSTLNDYGRFVRMVLRGGELDGNRVLSTEMTQLAGQNSMGALRVSRLASAQPAVSADAEFFPGVEKSWGLTFQINEQPAPTGRSARSLSWAGLWNTFFWIDPQIDVAGVFLSQTLPFVDPAVLGTFEEFERAVYDSLSA